MARVQAAVVVESRGVVCVRVCERECGSVCEELIQQIQARAANRMKESERSV